MDGKLLSQGEENMEVVGLIAAVVVSFLLRGVMFVIITAILSGIVAGIASMISIFTDWDER